MNLNNTKKPLISVIIPVYNCELFIERCLLSIIHNSYTELEVICVNDGSTDGSLSVIKRIAEQDDRIIVIDKENGGVSSARNMALQQASGEFLSFIDADDWVHHAFFELLMSEMDDGCDIVYCKMKNYTEEVSESAIGVVKKKIYTSEEAMKVRNAYTYVCARLIRATCFLNNRFNECLSFSEDILMNYHIIPKCRIIKELDIQLYYRYVRENSLIHIRDAELVIPVMDAFIKLSEEAKSDKTLIKRAYRTVLSGRYKNKITSKSSAYPQMMQLISRLKKQSIYLSRRERITYNFFIDHPRIFCFLSYVRKYNRQLLGSCKRGWAWMSQSAKIF